MAERKRMNDTMPEKVLAPRVRKQHHAQKAGLEDEQGEHGGRQQERHGDIGQRGSGGAQFLHAG